VRTRAPISAVALLATLAAGCASAPWRRDSAPIARAELLAATPLGVERGEAPRSAGDGEVLAVSPAMQDFLRAHVSRKADRATRLRQLVDAIVSDKSFGLRYDEKTRTAAETFDEKRGNCLSFSNLFVAMARQVSLPVDFQEVDTPPDWSLRDGAFVLNRHINVVVDLGRQGTQMVDFNMADFRTNYNRRPITDSRALAHHHNNLGVERMQAGDVAAALGNFRAAIERDPGFSPPWTNLGILYARRGYLDHALGAYLEALRSDGGDLVAMSNLANLYERRGDRERAALYRDRVSSHRAHNPYYRFQLAQAAFQGGDYDTAIGHLNYAVGRERNEDRFCYLLALSHAKKGNARAARRWLSRAQEVAATDVLKRRYASKRDNLLSGSPPEQYQ
jgi:Flp pilus assembly protein TadD